MFIREVQVKGVVVLGDGFLGGVSNCLSYTFASMKAAEYSKQGLNTITNHDPSAKTHIHLMHSSMTVSTKIF